MTEALSNEHFLRRLKPVLSRIVNSDGDDVDWRTPFTSALPHRLLLAPLSTLPAPVFEALAGASGEVILSALERFTEPRPIPMDWVFSPEDFEEYERLARVPVAQVVFPGS